MVKVFIFGLTALLFGSAQANYDGNIPEEVNFDSVRVTGPGN